MKERIIETDKNVSLEKANIIREHFGLAPKDHELFTHDEVMAILEATYKKTLSIVL